MQLKFDCLKQVALLLNQAAKLLNDCRINLFNAAVDLNSALLLNAGADSGYFLTVANEKTGGFPRKKLS